MTRLRRCDKCGFEISYSSGTEDIPDASGETVHSRMSAVTLEGETFDLCVEKGCLTDYVAESLKETIAKEKKLKAWIKKPKVK